MALLPQLWAILSVFAFPAPTETILVSQEVQRCVETVRIEPARIPLADVSATLA